MLAIILAGGRATRIGGGDKGRLILRGRSLFDHVRSRLGPQCETILLNANGDPARFADLGLPVLPDTSPDRPGPLAGILAGLDYAANFAPQVGFVLSVPVDTPFLPLDLAARLQDSRVADRSAIAIARSAGHDHPVIALWSVQLRTDLRHTLEVAQRGRVHGFIEHHPFSVVDWPAVPYDPFFNINTPDALAEAEQIAATYKL
jgi:molybdopterin-guanine dinucleotide biosynthesis protein A